MKPIRLSRYLVLVVGFLLLFTPSCTKQPGEHGGGEKGMGSEFTHDPYEAIGVYKHLENDGPNNTQKLHIRTNPPVKHVGKNSKIKFVTDGCELKFGNPPSTPDGLFAELPKQDPNDPNVWVGRSGTKAGSFEYHATCGSTEVEGNSPPIIIVDP